MNRQRLRGDYALLRADSLRLLILQENIISIKHLKDKNVANLHCLSNSGQLLSAMNNNDNQQLVFIALSDKLALTDSIPRNRYVVTTHKNTANIRWCWSEVLLLNDVDLLLTPMPALLCSALTPINAIVTLADGKQAFVCDFEHLPDYLMQSESESA